MINNNDENQEARANIATRDFIIDLINEGIGFPPVIDPEAALAYLITNIGKGDPTRVHRICRLAWGLFNTNPAMGRWPCVFQALYEIERQDAGLPPID